jgi:iron complex transport system ATP-binding protein
MKLRCINVGKKAGNRQILTQVNLEIASGEFCFVLGRNGAGKTTLLRLMAHLEAPSYGQIEVRDDHNHRLIAAAVLPRALAWVPSESPRPFDFTVYDTVIMGRFSYHRGFPQTSDHVATELALDEMGIRSLGQQSIVRLSSGEFQRVLIARALALQPRIIVMDEPSAHLDWPTAHDFFRRLRALTDAGMCIISSAHDPELAMKYGTRVIGLRNGLVATNSTISALESQSTLDAIYN